MFDLIRNLRKKAEELEKEKAKLQASINSISVGFIITDSGGNIETINSAAKALFCSREKANPNDPKLVKLEFSMDQIASQFDKRFDIKSQIKKVLESKKSFTLRDFEFKNLFLHIHITPIVLLKKKGVINLEFIGTTILIDDVTEEKILDRSRSDFFSIASHELKTPLAVIKGNTELIEKYHKPKDKMVGKIIEDIHTSAIRLIDIVSDFLDISHLEQGKISFNQDKIELVSLVENVIEGLQPIADKKKVVLKLKKPSTKITILADSNRTKQVLINLIGNSLKFTERGSVTVSFQDLGKSVKTLVADSGVGIAKNNQSLVFRKFELATSDPLTRDTNRSTGVGLYISKYLIEGMHGQIKLERSEVGKGSIFSFNLPKG